MVRGLGFRVEDLGLRAALEQSRQSRPDTGLGLQVRVDKTFEVVPSLLGSGEGKVAPFSPVSVFAVKDFCSW